MRIVYSFVVDRDPRFLRQALNLAHSLIAVGVAPRDILANLTPPALVYAQEFMGLGCRAAETPFFGDNKYCNKVAQLRNAPDDADFVVCCDTDLLFLRNIRNDLLPHEGQFVGKIVDFDNPPLEKLRMVASLFPDLPEIPETLADVNLRPTLAANFNGGLYVIPGAHLRRFSSVWEAEALALLHSSAARETLGEFGWHIDQISFCFALNRLGLAFDYLPISFNFPIHYPVPSDRSARAEDIRIVHYHDAIDENGFPDPAKVQVPEVKQLIKDAVENLRTLFYLEGRREFARLEQGAQFTFVMGFHRSGTSLLTSGCNAIGYDVGTGPMLAASTDNPKGYFENRALVQTNEAIFSDLDSDWDDIFFTFDGRTEEIYRKFSGRMVRALETNYLVQPGAHCVLKDPRIMQTYPLWRAAIGALGYHLPQILFVYRNPLECAESQKSRHDTGFKKSGDPFHFFGKDLRETLLLWYVYTVRFLLSLKDERATIVRYNDLIAQPAETMKRVAAWSGFSPDMRPLEDFANTFLEKGLRHHERTDDELHEATLDVPYVRTLFLQLEAASAQPDAGVRDLRRIGADHQEQLADLLQFGFLGRLFAVPKRRWRHERYMQAKR